MENTTSEQVPAISAAATRPRFSRRTVFIALIVAAVLIVAGLASAQGLIVAATVNGSPISRLAVISELENRGGSDALNDLIGKKLIDDEAQKKNIVIAAEELDGELKVIESQISSMGSTFEEQLAQQGLTKEDVRDQITTHLKLEKLLADQAQVSEEEIDAFVKAQKITLPTEDVAAARTKISEQIREDKVAELSDQFVADLRGKANITYYVTY